MSATKQRVFRGRQLDRIAFPIGGLGSGMFCLEGSGAFSHWSLRHHPDVFNEPNVFSAITIEGEDGSVVARLLEGPVPKWKAVFPWENRSGCGAAKLHFGFPCFAQAEFTSHFPFAQIALRDEMIPIHVEITGWSPFVPGDTEATSLPVGAVEYRFENTGPTSLKAVYSFCASNFMAEEADGQSIRSISGGFMLQQEGLAENVAAQGAFAAWIDDPAAKVEIGAFGETALFKRTQWNRIREGTLLAESGATPEKNSPGARIAFPISLAPGEVRTVRLLVAWYVPFSTQYQRDVPGTIPGVVLATPPPDIDPRTGFFRPWYAERFANLDTLISHWMSGVGGLREATQRFTECFYDTTLPGEAVEAVAANLSILKSPTFLRQFDGRIWAWEGCEDERGSCYGSCTHVWNYAQALPHLFPAFERMLRETEFLVCQDDRGHQCFRTPLPIAAPGHDFHAAADGQLGGIIKIYREWRISGDTDWLRSLWPKVRQSLDYCILTWDPDHSGVPVEPHHNTYDVEFWGPEGMSGSFQVEALRAAIEMGRALDDDVELYEKLMASGKTFLEQKLFNGDYFQQNIRWKDVREPDPGSRPGLDLETRSLIEREGPENQFGSGCLADGILGGWLAWASGVPPVLDPAKVARHVLSVYRHNFFRDLSEHVNWLRAGFAWGKEGGLISCSWPKEETLTRPFFFSDEVWTGTEYQVASHAIALGHVEKGLEIVRTLRARYDGELRNPYAEFECGLWYGRALASYALLQALSGARYDAVDATLFLQPNIAGDFRAFLSTATGFGTVGVRNGEPFVEVASGTIPYRRINYSASAFNTEHT